MILRKRYAALAVIIVGFVVSLYVLPLPRTVNELPANDVAAVPAPSKPVGDSVPSPEPARVDAPAVASKNSGAPKVETYSVRGVVVNAKDGQPRRELQAVCEPGRRQIISRTSNRRTAVLTCSRERWISS